MELKTHAPARSVFAVTAFAACLLFIASTATAQTINFGKSLPDGPIAPGYAGFNWGSAVNDPYGGGYGLTNFAASINQFHRSTPFDLTSVTFANLVSEATGDGSTGEYTTVISGFLGGTLVSSVTENYGAYSDPTFAGLNIDDVTRVTFRTTALLQDTYCCDAHGNPVTLTDYHGPDSTYVSSLTVSKVAVKAPEFNGSTAAAALTLLLGSLAVLRGRRVN
jgi:hypothetical protein